MDNSKRHLPAICILVLAGCANTPQLPSNSTSSPPNTLPNLEHAKSFRSPDTFPACENYITQTISPESFDSVVSKISNLPHEKNEFETSAQYEARLNSALKNTPLEHTISLNLDQEFIKYDADTEKLRISRYAIDNIAENWETIFGYGAPLYEKVQYSRFYKNIDLIVSLTDTVTGSYQGRNSFGVTANITEVERNVKGIFDRIANEGEDLYNAPTSYKHSQTEFVSEMNVEVETAQNLKRNLRAAAIVKAKEPWLATSSDKVGTPTINRPKDITKKLTVLIADIRCILITDETNMVISTVTTN